ncbi:MAG: GPR endopeptidase [Clostridiaceae bacterium]|nr:GPR endopeptidase [Clostridiaceae bacterium]
MQMRTDLALEAREMIDEKRSGVMKAQRQLPEGMTVTTEEKDHILITRIKIESDEAERVIGKKKGVYVTLELKEGELNTLEVHRELAYTLCEEVEYFTKRLHKKDPSIMVAGLGNRNITPDSLGPKVVETMIITRHAITDKSLQLELDERLGNVCAVAPGVLGITGIETSEIILSLVERIKPDIVFAIDALASRKTSRINTTIQLSDTGIVPGSGVGNRRMELSQETLKIPVVSIGVPTVVDALTLAKDLLEKAEGGELEPSLITSISQTCGADMVVTPKNIDISIKRMATAISDGLNMAFHKGFDFGDISEYLM